MREDHTFRHHRIIADDSSGKAIAQIYLGKRRVGERLEAETLEGVISAAKRWVSDRLSEQRARQREPNIGTRERYAEFLSTQSVSDHERTMLQEHARKGVMTAEQIAHAARWESFSSANTQYGKLGRRIAEFVGLDPRTRDNGTPIWTTALAGDLGRGGDPNTSHFEWQMHDELAEALVDAGFLETRPSWLDDKSLLAIDASATGLSPRTRLKLTGGNIRNAHIYLKDHLLLFPPDSIGGSNKTKAAEKKLILDFEHGESVETDIDGADKKIFRDRGAVRRFFETALARPGDEVEIENTAPYRFSIRLIPQRQPDPITDEALRERLESDNPRVWLTSFDGFTPETWGCVGFSKEGRLDTFLAESGPDPIMVVYGSKTRRTPESMRGKVLGMYVLSDQRGEAEEFVDPVLLRRARAEAENKDGWAFSVRATRAWSIPIEQAPDISDFADQTWSPVLGKSIGSQGVALKRAEVLKLLNLEMEERQVYRGPSIDPLPIEPLSDYLRPTKAGPLPKRGWTVEPPNGEKHLYVLKLAGDPGAFLNGRFRVRGDSAIYKVGMSRHPSKRQTDINRNYPAGVYRWDLLLSTHGEGFIARDAAMHTVVGEDAMKDFLELKAESLGGEFFLANEKLIREAWALGKKMAGFGGDDEQPE
ncbi:hypothetical protein [Maricaulis sp. MIT060901]|uniref:hypothetical protein n=1 Tax=Maricaulis sp. MIT060901 TaxID=3096993 RepID=UPI00399954D7